MTATETGSSAPVRPQPVFATTHWSVVLAATPKLDAIRHEVVGVAAEVNRRRPPVRESTFAATIAKVIRVQFQELIWPCRRVWTGLAAVRILLFVVNLSQRDGAQTVGTNSAPMTMMSIREQQKLVNALFADRSPSAEAEPPRICSPKPRTEKSETHCV
jgi:hypothetical protein